MTNCISHTPTDLQMDISCVQKPKVQTSILMYLCHHVILPSATTEHNIVKMYHRASEPPKDDLSSNQNVCV